jgi:hypothetical protein
MKTIFGYHVINVPGTWTYKILKATNFEPKFNNFNYVKANVKDLSTRMRPASTLLSIDDNTFDEHVNQVLDIQVNNYFA